MTDLITRLEAATEGSRELDAEIFCAVRGLVFDEECPVRADGKRYIDFRRVPKHTRSLDAALTLVPEGYCWAVNSSQPPGGNQFRAEIDCGGAVWAATPALALCAATLRARETG